MESTKKSIIATIVTIITGIVAYQLINHFVFPPVSFESELMQTAENINQNCPFMVDQDTRLENTMGGPGKTFSYFYTLVNYDSSELDIEELKQSLLPTLTNFAKTSEDMETFRSNKVELKYNYKDKNGNFLFSIIVNPNDFES